MAKKDTLSSEMFLLHIKGVIKGQKQKEFNQSVSFLMEHVDQQCVYYYLASDIQKVDIFHFYSLWTCKEALNNFIASEDYKALLGAFDVLGAVQQSTLMQLLEQINIKKEDLNNVIR